VEIQDLTKNERMNAYAEIKARFSLGWKQRDRLDGSPFYGPILVAAHLGEWADVTRLLANAGITEGN
jgi:hypothetical protein